MQLLESQASHPLELGLLPFPTHTHNTQTPHRMQLLESQASHPLELGLLPFPTHTHNTQTPHCRQLLESQASHPLELGLLPVGSTLFPMCLGSIKHAMIGASLHTPGLLTLLSNLTMSCDVKHSILVGTQRTVRAHTKLWSQ
jgi:hypothetical protein